MSLLSQSSLSSTDLNVATTFVTGHPRTKDLSGGSVASDTSYIHVASHNSHTRILCLSLKVVLDLKEFASFFSLKLLNLYINELMLQVSLSLYSLLLGHQQQVIEEEQVPVLCLHSLKGTKINREC